MRPEPAERAKAGARRRRVVVAVLLVALFVLHQDSWLWNDARLVLGLPVGLAYHVVFCLAATLVLTIAVRWSWPREAAAVDAEEPE